MDTTHLTQPNALQEKGNETLKSIIDNAFEHRPQEIMVPKIEWHDCQDMMILHAELPGLTAQEISVIVKDNILLIEGDRRNHESANMVDSEISYGRYRRAVPLAAHLDPKLVNANYKNGMLVVKVSKKVEA